MSSRSSRTSRSFCIRAASSPSSVTVFSGRIVTSASSGFRPAARSAACTASKPALLDSTSIAPSSSVSTSSAPASSATSITLSSLVPGREHELAAFLELEGDRAFGAHVAAVLAEGVAHLGHGAHPVVGHRVDDDRRAADAVALVADLLVGDAFEVAGRLVDVLLDRVGRHVRALGLLDREAQPRIHRQVAAAVARGDHDLADQPGPDLAALLVLAALAVLDVRPLGMTGHGTSFAALTPAVGWEGRAILRGAAPRLAPGVPRPARARLGDLALAPHNNSGLTPRTRDTQPIASGAYLRLNTNQEGTPCFSPLADWPFPLGWRACWRRQRLLRASATPPSPAAARSSSPLRARPRSSTA